MYIVHPIQCILITSVVLGALAPLHLLVTRVGPCDLVGAVVTVSEFDVIAKIYEASLSGQLNITQDIQNGWKVKGTMQKCQDIRNTDTCDFFKSFYVVQHGCEDEDEDEDEEEFNDMFFHYTHPRLGCPIRKGIYNVERYPVFSGEDLMMPEAKISTSMFGYTIRLDGLSHTRKKLFCVEAFIQLLYVREHNWSAKSLPYLPVHPTHTEQEREDRAEENSINNDTLNDVGDPDDSSE